MTNKDEQDNINQMDLNYSIKVTDQDGNESLPIGVSIDNSTFSLPFDGQTEESKEINITLNCPAEYVGADILNCRVKVVATGISNTNFTTEKFLDFTLNIQPGVDNGLLNNANPLLLNSNLLLNNDSNSINLQENVNESNNNELTEALNNNTISDNNAEVIEDNLQNTENEQSNDLEELTVSNENNNELNNQDSNIDSISENVVSEEQ